MFSILNEIKEYIENNGIPFNDIDISYTYFPKYFNQAVLNYIRKYSGVNYDLGPSEYTLSFDKNGSIYLMVHDNNNKVNLCIANTMIHLDDNMKFSVVPEIDLFEEAAMLKYLDEQRFMIREMINNNYSNLSSLDKIKLENNIINTLVKSKFKEFSNKKKSILDKVEVKDEIEESVDKITEYINYLNDYYMEDLRLAEEENQMQGIYYNEPESDRIIRKGPGGDYRGQKERNHPIIPANDRISILNNYHYIYRDFGYTNDNKEIKNLNYLYKLDYGMYLLVLEPYNGIKYTKMAIVTSDHKIMKDEFDELVRYYLELSNREFDNQGNTVKICHTSLESYINKIDYAITSMNDKINNQYFVERVKKIKKQ